MDDPKKTTEKKAAKTDESEKPEPIFPGEVVPEDQWEDHEALMRQTLFRDD